MDTLSPERAVYHSDGRASPKAGAAHRKKGRMFQSPEGATYIWNTKPLAMGQSLIKNYLHITFSTKNRHPFIKETIENDLYAYIGSTCNRLDCSPIKIGGFDDHVHILCLLSKKITAMKLLEEIKSNSSRWMKTKGNEFAGFYWQDGYGAFSVNPSEIDVVSNYISNQREHHKNISFQDEYRAFLKKYKVDYDERYVWD